MPDHIKQTARQERPWDLHLADGRDSPGHLKHRLFHGLWPQQHMAQQEGITPPQRRTNPC